jgi:CRP/FNR family cyclic AMP-dependent transcriptional regulator
VPVVVRGAATANPSGSLIRRALQRKPAFAIRQLGGIRAMNQKEELPFDPKMFFSKAKGGRTVATYAINQSIYQLGDPADSVFYILKGKVKFTVISEQGREAVVAFLGDDEFFGEACIGGEALRLSTATAITACTIARIPKAEFDRLIHNEPGFSELFITRLLARSDQIRADLVDQLFNSSEKRLARALLLLAKVDKDGESDAVLANVNQETLAEMIGTTRPRVNFFMNKFRRLGLIDYNGQIKVHHPLLSMFLHEGPKTESGVERPQ